MSYRKNEPLNERVGRQQARDSAAAAAREQQAYSDKLRAENANKPGYDKDGNPLSETEKLKIKQREEQQLPDEYPDPPTPETNLGDFQEQGGYIDDEEEEIDPNTGWPTQILKGLSWVGEKMDWLDDQVGIPGTNIDVYHARQKPIQFLSKQHFALGLLGEIFIPDSIDLASYGLAYIPNRFRRAGKAGVKLWARMISKSVDTAKPSRHFIDTSKGFGYASTAGKADDIDVADSTIDAVLQGIEDATKKTTRKQGEVIDKDLVYELVHQFKHVGATPEIGKAFQTAMKTAESEVIDVVKWLNARSLLTEPRTLEEFTDSIAVALGKPDFDPSDFIGNGKLITYNSNKGKEAIASLQDLEEVLAKRIATVANRGAFSLGHILAVRNIINRGDLGASRLSNMEPEVFRSILKFATDSTGAPIRDFPLEQIAAVLGNAARKDQDDMALELLQSMGVSSSIDEEFLKFLDPDVRNFWKEVNPIENIEWFEETARSKIRKKIGFATKHKRKNVPIGQKQELLKKLRQQAIDETLNELPANISRALSELGDEGLIKRIAEKAPEIIVDLMNDIEHGRKFKVPKKGSKYFTKYIRLKRQYERGSANLKIDSPGSYGQDQL